MWKLLKHLIVGNTQHNTDSEKAIEPMKKSSDFASADGLRAKLLNQSITPEINHIFAKFPNINSAMFLVAQYWCDEANDAVHSEIVYSELETPDLAAAANIGYEQEDYINRPNVNSEFFFAALEGVNESSEWDCNGEAITAFACYCKEDCHQEMENLEAYLPYALFTRDGPKAKMQVVGTMVRPWLDGVIPE